MVFLCADAALCSSIRNVDIRGLREIRISRATVLPTVGLSARMRAYNTWTSSANAEFFIHYSVGKTVLRGGRGQPLVGIYIVTFVSVQSVWRVRQMDNRVE